MFSGTVDFCGFNGLSGTGGFSGRGDFRGTGGFPGKQGFSGTGDFSAMDGFSLLVCLLRGSGFGGRVKGDTFEFSYRKK